jgi:hypothetical protein
MTQTIRVALPTYDAQTDTNQDHYALYADQDNVLIKEFTRGSVSITGNGSQVISTITHNLGYIPFFLVYVFDTQALHNPNKWMLLAHNTAGASTPPYLAVADTTNLYIYNFLAAAAGAISFKYYIFYDDITGGGSPAITESAVAQKVSKQGIDALAATNPNNYIFHSDLNTFKILKEGNATINYTTDGVYTFAHGATLSNPTSFLVYMKFPDGKTGVLPGKGFLFSYDSSFNVSETYIDTTNIGMYIAGPGSAQTLTVKYYIFETPLS